MNNYRRPMSKFTLIKDSYLVLNSEIKSIFSQIPDVQQCVKIAEEVDRILPLLEESAFGDHLILNQVVDLVKKALELSYWLYKHIKIEHDKIVEIYPEFIDRVEGVYTFTTLENSIDPFAELLSAYSHVKHTKALLSLTLIKEQLMADTLCGVEVNRSTLSATLDDDINPQGTIETIINKQLVIAN